MYTNIGPRPAQIGGRTLLLTPLSPEAMSTIVDHVWSTKRRTALSHVIPELNNLPPELAKVAVETAVRLDNAEKFAPIELPKSALLDPDVVALVLHLTAVPENPDFTLDACKKLVEQVGAVMVLANIAFVFPGDPEKKDGGSSANSASGPESSGSASATT